MSKPAAPKPTDNLQGWAEAQVSRLTAMPSFNTVAGPSEAASCIRGRRQGRRRALRRLYADLHEFDPLTRDRIVRDVLDLVDLHLNAERA